MYVCVCNAITDSDVQDAKALGAVHEDDIFDHFGVEPLCGRCCDMMGQLLGGCGHSHCGQGHCARKSLS